MAEDDTELSGKVFGFPVSVRGTYAIVIIVLLVFAVGQSFMSWKQSEAAIEAGREAVIVQSNAVRSALAAQSLTTEAHRQLLQSTASVVENQGNIIKGMEALTDTMDANNYIAMQSEQWREANKSKMQRPKIIRELLKEH